MHTKERPRFFFHFFIVVVVIVVAAVDDPRHCATRGLDWKLSL